MEMLDSGHLLSFLYNSNSSLICIEKKIMGKFLDNKETRKATIIRSMMVRAPENFLSKIKRNSERSCWKRESQVRTEEEKSGRIPLISLFFPGGQTPAQRILSFSRKEPMKLKLARYLSDDF